MNLQLANIKEGEWNWFFRWQQVILIGFSMLSLFLLSIAIIIISTKR